MWSNECVANEHKMGQGTKTAGNGREERGDVFDRSEIYVANNPAIYGIDTGIED